MRQRAARVCRVACAAILGGVLFVAGAGLASAHEHREVADGQYEMGVGFLQEPAISGEPNGLALEVHKVAAEEGEAQGTPAAGEEGEEEGAPVEGLQDTLQAEVSFGGQTRMLVLEAAFGEPGLYEAHFIPTAVGAYTFHIFGTIEGNTIDESFTGGPDTFSEVDDRASLNFPAMTDSATGANAEISDAQDTADTAQTLGIVGIIVGVLGLATGVGGVLMARNARTTSAPAATRSADASDY